MYWGDWQYHLPKSCSPKYLISPYIQSIYGFVNYIIMRIYLAYVDCCFMQIVLLCGAPLFILVSAFLPPDSFCLLYVNHIVNFLGSGVHALSSAVLFCKLFTHKWLHKCLVTTVSVTRLTRAYLVNYSFNFHKKVYLLYCYYCY